MFFDNKIEPIVLRESLRARVTVTPISIPATFFSIFLFIPFLLSLDVAYGSITLWVIPIILLMIARGLLSKWANARMDQFSNAQMIRVDWMLRISSILNQTAVGSGIWIMYSPSADYFVLPLFMTLVVIIWSIGVLGNLFSDFGSFILSMPLLIGQPAVFWLVRGDIGISIGIGMLLAMTLMVLLVHRGTAIFRDSVLMRFEKDRLLEKVELERQKTQQALREAQAANDSKSYFMAAASHDIKQPLYALGMLTDTLLMSNPSASAVELLQHQRDSIAQMSEHFDALMDMGRYQGDTFELNLTNIELRNFSSRVDDEIAPLCARKGLAWNLAMEDAMVVSDKELLLRLFRNLLTNAVRYTDQGEVSCHAKVKGDFVHVLISDTGSGIAAEHQELVFKEFVRLDNSSADSTGAGLGLSIVEKINRALELGLELSSSPDEGTRFSFRLPVALV